MASQSNSPWSLFIYTFPLCLTFVFSVHGNNECYRVTAANRRGSGQSVHVSGNFCVRELSCYHTKDKVVMSWTQADNNANTMDFLIFLTNVTNVTNVYSVKINEADFLTVDEELTTETLNSSTTLPGIDINTDYKVTVKRRYNLTEPTNAYATSTACTKVSRTTISTKTTNNGFKKQLVTYSPGKTGSNNNSARSGSLYTIIGFSVAGLVLLIVIVVMFVKVRKKRQSRNENARQREKARTDPENNRPDGENTYNHLSRDSQDRRIKIAEQNSYLKDNRANKEGTYNHLSRVHKETNTSTAQQSNEDDTYNHLSLSHQGRQSEAIGGNINLISVSVHTPTTLDDDAENEKIQVRTDKINETSADAANVVTESADDTKQQDSPVDDVMEPSRKQGSKGDVYTEIELNEK